MNNSERQVGGGCSQLRTSLQQPNSALAKPFRRFQEKGGHPPFETLGPIYLDAGEPLDDLKERWWGGRAAGEVFKTLFLLANTEPPLASWKHAIQIVEETTKRNKVKGGRTKLLQAKDRFLSVAHLWAAW